MLLKTPSPNTSGVLKKFKVDETLSVCLSVFPSPALSQKPVTEAIAIKFDKVTASVMRMHHVSMFSS